jgi:tetratricopeptide (TPR) repeat protein
MAPCTLALLLVWVAPLVAQDQKETPPQPPAKKQDQLKTERPQPQTSDKEEVPPEEDKNMGVRDYTFNPLQAERELQTGNFYFKKGNYRGAAGRYREATNWNNGYPEAWLKLGEAEEKLKDKPAALEAYNKYLEIAPDAKNAPDVRKKVEKLK